MKIICIKDSVSNEMIGGNGTEVINKDILKQKFYLPGEQKLKSVNQRLTVCQEKLILQSFHLRTPW